MATRAKISRAKKPKIGKGISFKHELFCRFYTHNDALRGNATHSYAEAYEYKLDTLPTDDEVFDWEGQGEGAKQILVEKSTYDKAINVCAVEGARLIRNPKIQKRITELFNELLADDVVDKELVKVILQDDDLRPKVAAISEYNKLRQRITDKVDLTTGGEPIKSIQYVVPK